MLGMAKFNQNLYISNMPTPTPSDPIIQSYSLFGESTHLPDVMHCETIAERSVLHDWELAPHRHARLHQVMLVQSGGGLAHLDDQAVTLTPGCVVNVPPGHVHAFRFEKGTQGWVVTLADELLDEILAHVGDVRQSLAQCCIHAGDAQVTSLMGHIWQEYQASAPARALVLRGLSATLLGWMARALTPTQDNSPAATESRLVQRLRALIDQHYLAHWSVADYARALSVSTTHLTRVTRAATGVPTSALIEARTMREARRHLTYTHLSITTIAYALGYADPAYFTRVFTRDAGISPRGFRARLTT
jgi:AraC family transcriptional activator of pobA